MTHSNEEVCQFHSGIETDIRTMKDSIKQIELKIDRPPVWLTFIFAGMSFVLGSAISWMIHLHTIAKSVAQSR